MVPEREDVEHDPSGEGSEVPDGLHPHRLFWNVSIRDPRHYSDHYMVMGCYRSAPLREHSKYLGGRKRIPLQAPTTPTREDRIFVALRRSVLKPQARDTRKNASILETTWRIVEKRVSARQYPAKEQSLIWRLGCAIAESLKGDRRRRSKEAGAELETLFGSDPPSTGKLDTG